MPHRSRGTGRFGHIALCAVLPALLCPGRIYADGADLRGHIRLPDGANAPFAAVWLENDTHATPLRRAQIDQRGKTFLPHVLIVTPGTTVTFPNNDTIFHNVFAYFEAKRFDLGMYPQGVSKAVTFDKTGIVSVLCNVHPKMSAFVVVADTPYTAVSRPDGTFRIPSLPPGTYRLHIWHESGSRSERPLTIGTDGSTLDITLERR